MSWTFQINQILLMKLKLKLLEKRVALSIYTRSKVDQILTLKMEVIQLLYHKIRQKRYP